MFNETLYKRSRDLTITRVMSHLSCTSPVGIRPISVILRDDRWFSTRFRQTKFCPIFFFFFCNNNFLSTAVLSAIVTDSNEDKSHSSRTRIHTHTHTHESILVAVFHRARVHDVSKALFVSI